MPAISDNALRLLNVGCGAHFDERWINIDIAPSDPRVATFDIQKPLPFENDYFEVVYHSHVLEHLPKRAAPPFIAECARVLKPGGIIRVVIPDLEMICRVYLEVLGAALRGEPSAAERYDWITVEMLDQMVREESGGEMLRFWSQRPVPAKDFVIERVGRIAGDFIDRLAQQPASQEPERASTPAPEEIGRFRVSGEVHKWMYDRFSLQRLLSGAGFEDCRTVQAWESAIPDFASYALDVESDGQTRKPDSLFMEARKRQ